MRFGSQCGHGILLVSLLVSFAAVAPCAQAQDTQPPAPASSNAPAATPADKTATPSPAPDPGKKSDNKQEVSMQDTTPTFKVRVNLVQVRVVVRDSADKPVENLKREDFLVYDQGRLQSISTFNIENSGTRRARAEAAAKTQSDASGKNIDAPLSLPERFVAMVFDDAHLTMEDAVFIRTSANKFLDSISPSDRVALYTTSGQVSQEFTSDKEALKKALLGVIPRALMDSGRTECPDVSYYMADLIENKSDTQAMGVVVEDTIQCQFDGDRSKTSQAQGIAQGAVLRALNAGNIENEYTYRHLEDIMRRLAGMPGERIMLLASPGFQLSNQYLDEMGIIDRATRANIVINTLDARGLYTPDVMGDISRPSGDTFRTGGYRTMYRVSAQTAATYVLRDFAAGTGGTYFGNSNDLVGGFKLVGTTPETSYVLGFSPQNQKMDGRYHTIKVSLANKQKFSVQARRGYYAPRKVDDPQEQARAEIQEAVFSQEEIGDLPLELQTQYFKNDQTTKLSVVSHLGVKGIHFRKADGRNIDNLTLATAIFDENGNFVTGGEKILEMKLLDTTYERMSRSGLTVKSSFDVKPGRYLVREVVRDSEGAQMAARNGAVEIP